MTSYTFNPDQTVRESVIGAMTDTAFEGFQAQAKRCNAAVYVDQFDSVDERQAFIQKLTERKAARLARTTADVETI